LGCLASFHVGGGEPVLKFPSIVKAEGEFPSQPEMVIKKGITKDDQPNLN
jgi:hypothetical protein